jgi:hypothetical protein
VQKAGNLLCAGIATAALGGATGNGVWRPFHDAEL